jgi:hypothetical protein
VLCIDEAHERGRTILFATDPLLDATVGWKIVKTNDQDSMDGFLDELKAAGFRPEVVVTDGSALYKESLTARWREVKHQLCIFHVLQDAGREILDAVRDIRGGLPPPRRHRRGRPCRRGRPRRKDDRRAFIIEHLHLVVKQAESWTQEDRRAWARLLEIDVRFGLLREFVERLYACFQKDITPRQARCRRTRLVNDPRFGSDPHLRKVMAMLAPEKFEKMIVFLSHPRAERTNNHVERNNRAFRLVQKTRYRRRRTHTIELALWLHIACRWRKHPKYQLALKSRGRARPAAKRRAA